MKEKKTKRDSQKIKDKTKDIFLWISKFETPSSVNKIEPTQQ